MKVTRRQVIQWGAGLVAFSRLNPLVASQKAVLKTSIPSTGQQLPAVGMGTVRLRGNPGSLEMQRYGQTLAAFYSLGGRLLDTSPNYGNSEDVLGRLMREQGIRDEMFIATKVDREEREAGRQRMEDSFKLLGGEQIDLMQVHNLRGTEVQLETMKIWKKQGRFRYIGITTHTANQYEDFERVMRSHQLDFIQVNYSLAERGAAERILPLAQDSSLAVLVNRPFGRGSLFSAVGDTPLPDWAAEIDASTWGQVFLKYVISHPAATVPIPGTSKPQHAVDNMTAARGRLPGVEMRREMEQFMDRLL
jgi:aryl-alcohol dehydrogenase-like predicted oxidoreductase